MKHRCLTDRDEIESRFRRVSDIHLYEIGDLDDFFFPYTTWYSRAEDTDSDEIVLVYRGSETPSVLAFTQRAGGGLAALLESIADTLPDTFHAHLSDGLVQVLETGFGFESFGRHDKMALVDPNLANRVDVSGTVSLGSHDLEEVEALYARAYPDGWFDCRMLETNMYFGIRTQSRLVAIAGVHVFSGTYRVAALGNITTDPDFRGRGLATSVTARLTRELAGRCDSIGLNVKSNNEAALACYRKLGYEKVLGYDEGRFSRG